MCRRSAGARAPRRLSETGKTAGLARAAPAQSGGAINQPPRAGVDASARRVGGLIRRCGVAQVSSAAAAHSSSATADPSARSCSVWACPVRIRSQVATATVSAAHSNGRCGRYGISRTRQRPSAIPTVTVDSAAMTPTVRSPRTRPGRESANPSSHSRNGRPSKRRLLARIESASAGLPVSVGCGRVLLARLGAITAAIAPAAVRPRTIVAAS